VAGRLFLARFWTCSAIPLWRDPGFDRFDFDDALDADHQNAFRFRISLNLMPSSEFPLNALVVYKKRPGRILASRDKIEVELPDGEHIKVRPKDVTLLHPGPLEHLDALAAPNGDIQTAWELLSGRQTNLKELAELTFGEFTPASAWAAWELLEDGLYFRGTPAEITVLPQQDVERQIAERQAKARELSEWNSLLNRLRAGNFDPGAVSAQQRKFLLEVEQLALEKRADSRLLQELGRAQHPENAHALLLDIGVWDAYVDPYPARLGIPKVPPQLSFPPLPDEPRLDLTSLPAFAIDDEENQDPDDAISLDGNELWVHIADAAAAIPPGSPIDLEARTRGANAYLPQGAIPMLPLQAVAVLGMGLAEISPALSFHLHISADGIVNDVEILPSLVRVQRLSYRQAQEQLDHGDEQLNRILRVLQPFLARRHLAGALSIDLPEVIIKLKGKKVEIRPVLSTSSRDLVREAMLAAGQGAALFAQQNQIPIPYAIQESTPNLAPAEDMAGRFELRKKMKRSQLSLLPGLHAGLGLQPYTRATSPLRRYQDLLVHQQVRAHLAGLPLRDDQDALNSAGMAEAGAVLASRAESLSRRHWTLVYLLQNPGWSGEAVLVERSGMAAKFLIPTLAWETTLHLTDDLPLNARVAFELSSINLAKLDAYFHIRKK
jgi:exoribonuclease-2